MAFQKPELKNEFGQKWAKTLFMSRVNSHIKPDLDFRSTFCLTTFGFEYFFYSLPILSCLPLFPGTQQ